MIKGVLLWASRNAWLGRTLPRKKFVQRAVRRFMPGDGRDEAIRAALELRDRGIPAVFTLLGENVTSQEAVDGVVAEYKALLAQVKDSGLDAQISVKLTQLGLDLGEELALEQLVDLASLASAQGSLVWIDMEDSSYREVTLRLYREAVARTSPAEVGLCLQAYLFSTPSDLEELLPISPVIRFVKGAYAEPPELAFPRRRDVDEAFFQLGTTVLESTGKVAFATHDSVLTGRLRAWIGHKDVDKGRYEFQMLYGIRAEEQLRLARDGEPIRILISYGPAWFPWYMRRLAERPANIWFVVKNLFRA